MSHLSGKLETFSLRQILVLLADADATGELHVASPTMGGRVFLQSGVVAYGTARAGEASVAELDDLLKKPSGDKDKATRAAVQEQLTELLHDLIQLESGTFNFEEGAPSTFDVGVTFTVVELLRMVDERVEEWRKIRKVIPASTTQLSLARELPGDRSEVMVDKDSWGWLAAVAGGASSAEVADSRGVSEFRAAQNLAELVKWGVLNTDSVPAPTESRTPFAELESLEPAVEFSDEFSDTPPFELMEDPLPDPAPEPKGATAATPRVDPKVEPVSFSKKDLTPEERDELIRNIGKGIYPD